MTPKMPDRFTGSNPFEPCPADSEALIARFLHDARFSNASAMHAAAERAANLYQAVQELR
jgi:hypothetical protein